jgi:hypothetical protein
VKEKVYDKYEYTTEGWFIMNADKYNDIRSRPSEYKRKKYLAYLWFLIPICGIIGYDEYMKQEFGVDVL